MILGLLLASCGTGSAERGVSGAGLGAAAGAVVGAVTGLTVLEGALIGTGLGAALGAFTDADTINLGPPIWRQSSAAPRNEAPESSSLVATAQSNLARLGYEPGPIDGYHGPRTSEAVRQFQRDHGLPVDGELSGPVAWEIESQAAALPQ